MSVINTNITAMIGQQNLNQSQNALSTSMERLSSGLKINSAADDAAGQAIANRMSSQINGLSQAQSNANDGISVAQTAEGALNQVNDNLQRVRELTVQAQNGTNSDSDLSSIQDEINQRLGEIDRISEETDFNGVKVLAEDQELSIQVGANDNESISVSLEKIDKTTLGLASFDVTGSQSAKPELGEQVGYNDELGEVFEVIDKGTGEASTDVYGAKAEDGSIIAVKTADSPDTTNQGYEAVTYKDGTNNGINATLQYDAANADNDDYSQGDLKITGTNGDGKTVAVAALATASTGDDVDLTGANAGEGAIDDLAKGGLAQIDSALSSVDSLRSGLGAMQNRFDSAITNLSTTETNLTSARSRIEDADYADEVSNMTKNQILQQAGTSVLSQANQLPQNALSLLG
ncbi:FliC/FljB family flagellin [Chromohalobacter japonicus]|uniref:FliC/FljB family flagellin n=1 Tax=Chromohalobacter japonicus TaxID=223900 RepID=UPI001FF5CD8D|nr:FliC/FljB family flagellin [Chromohalobacter japonicus]MCK0754416.1 FliC/FljB family flagellin [Chromohalobacter japonicus]